MSQSSSKKSSNILNDRYQIQSKLGQGAIATTYRALDQKTQQQVAIKAVSLKQLQNWKQLELFQREAKVLKQLDHPQIPHYLDDFIVDTNSNRTYCLVQQLAPGKSLQSLVDSGWRTNEEQVKQIAVQLLEILNYLQQQDPPIIHRDIKPDNIIFDQNQNKLYLVDFGAVRNAYYSTVMAGSTVAGTYGYMPPEQFQNRVVPASDLYGLGATLLFLLTRRDPAQLPHEMLRIQFQDHIQVTTTFSKWLETILSPDVEERFSTAEKALTALKQKPQWWKLPQKLINRNLLLVGGPIVAVLLLGIVGRVNYWRISENLGIEADKSRLCQDYSYTQDYLNSGGFKQQEHLTACIAKSAELAQYLIQRKYDLSFIPLVDAVTQQNIKLVGFLLDHRSKLNPTNKDSLPLIKAVETGNIEIVELLLDRGANVNEAQANHHVKDKITPLMMAISKKDEELAELLITQGADINQNMNSLDLNNSSPLMAAIYQGDPNMIRLLIQNDADVNYIDAEKRTPLTSLVFNKHYGRNKYSRGKPFTTEELVPLINLLIDKGANVNQVGGVGKDRFSRPNRENYGFGYPLEFALYSNDESVVKLLLDRGADVNKYYRRSKTPLSIARLKKNKNLEKLLVGRGAKE
ncbi:ankyrin repeat domain-containing protein [Nodularia spumigena CS-584]|uniref:protein kinase domain-containing protein n=1 Tax=Nodularia spumigena TaxID=70799 RepID=UPI0000EAAAF4|nr:ankyrin repeat domain-containing protein [Nodularia spumigena]AHJ30967.1 serine/threonine kinase [Nodularia spumigena CCY9414]EAW46384.1 serine/threonine kinase [Nodularia spumigena CCY9414]MDB9382762.1 ankyrin repeat domain-containing protein [Nodularia spumigena CS-584]